MDLILFKFAANETEAVALIAIEDARRAAVAATKAAKIESGDDGAELPREAQEQRRPLRLDGHLLVRPRARDVFLRQRGGLTGLREVRGLNVTGEHADQRL